MELKCRWCGETKPEDQFVLRSRSRPVSQSNVRCCRQCSSEYQRGRYSTLPLVRAKQLRMNAAWRKAHPDKMRAHEKKYLDKIPAVSKARNRVGYLIRSGAWMRQPCVICGKAAEAHHESYAEPHWDMVKWLCKDHHESWHQHFNPTRDAILAERLVQVERLRSEAYELQDQITLMRQKLRALFSQADALELSSWNQVIEAATPMFSEFAMK